ncbi:MAG: MerR family transcriptional regulator [Acidobacteria bacterium]|nr:MerR family transcriptional regulator [Acidobacteriota bacterium]
MKRSAKIGRSRSAEVVVPDKLYFRIGEVARLCRLPTYVLRFWEKEFAQLRPNKSSTGQRMYRRREVETALRVKHLLYEEGFTIAGARLQLRAEVKTGRQNPLPFAATASRRDLLAVRQGLKDVLGILSARR